MLFGLYIANKLRRSKRQTFTRTVIRLATAAVSISIAVVIISFGVLFGFKQEIRNKVSGYAGHMTIKNFDLSDGNESVYIRIDSNLIKDVQNHAEVRSVYPFINKAGILKSDSVLEGLIFRGIPHDYDLSFYQKNLVRGELPEYSADSQSYTVLLSEKTALMLNADTGSRLNLYFIDNSDVKRRRVIVAGIFNTGLTEFDKQFAIMDLRALQRVISSGYQLIGGYEVKIKDFDKLQRVDEELSNITSYNLEVLTIRDQYQTIFQWLKIVDTNVLVIIVLMFTVAIINIITVLLILIIERIPMIGLFKAMGANNRVIMNIFSWQGVFILMGGILIGNAIALGLGFLQTRYHLIGLSAETYYMDAVPFFIQWEDLLLINITAIVLAYFFTLIPSLIVSGVSPSRSIVFR